MKDYVCSNCGDFCYYDGRCGDGPVLMCECFKKGVWINDGRGGYHVYPNNAHPVSFLEYQNKRLK